LGRKKPPPLVASATQTGKSSNRVNMIQPAKTSSGNPPAIAILAAMKKVTARGSR
jgi:hypothetical protein